jgi:VIT1/CCC1 family predicted Fe2+/Mn2+ transporter
MHHESHRHDRIGWLRAAVLGANDGLISTSAIIVGVASAAATRHDVLLAGLAGMVAGALSMAAGEYVSVSSQADTEAADLARERRELAEDPEGEHAELRAIWMERGLDKDLADQVATALEKHDALGAHARDELGITEITRANPLQAALASAVALALLAPLGVVTWAVTGATLALLAALGALAGHLGGASLTVGAARVTFWGAVAMGVTALVGRLFGASV